LRQPPRRNLHPNHYDDACSAKSGPDQVGVNVSLVKQLVAQPNVNPKNNHTHEGCDEPEQTPVKEGTLVKVWGGAKRRRAA